MRTTSSTVLWNAPKLTGRGLHGLVRAPSASSSDSPTCWIPRGSLCGGSTVCTVKSNSVFGTPAMLMSGRVPALSKCRLRETANHGTPHVVANVAHGNWCAEVCTAPVTRFPRLQPDETSRAQTCFVSPKNKTIHHEYRSDVRERAPADTYLGCVPRRLCACHRPVSRVVKVVTKRDSGLPWVALE